MKHTWFECKCGQVDCQFCGGGLGACTVCRGFEGTLTTDCVGKRLQEPTLNAVWKGYIDFIDGRWVSGRLWWDGKLHTWKEWRQRRERAKDLYKDCENGIEWFSQSDWKILLEYNDELKRQRRRENEQKENCRAS